VTDEVEDTGNLQHHSRGGSAIPPDDESEISAVESTEDIGNGGPTASAEGTRPASRLATVNGNTSLSGSSIRAAGRGTFTTPKPATPSSSADGSVSFYHQILQQQNQKRAREAAELRAKIARTNAAAVKRNAKPMPKLLVRAKQPFVMAPSGVVADRRCGRGSAVRI